MADHEERPALAPQGGLGPRLKAAREAAGFSLVQMADQTKIPARMLLLIEAGDFAGLPARTYATGFTRTYARQLGLDEREAVAAVRSELGLSERTEKTVIPTFEPGDPARVPSARFAWLAAVAALVVLAAGLFLWRTYYAPAVTLPPVLPEETASAAPPAAPPAILPPPPAAIAPAGAAGALAEQPVPQVPPAPVSRSAPAGRVAAPAAPAAQPLEAEAPVPASTAQN